jgi:hypothetical protein
MKKLLAISATALLFSAPLALAQSSGADPRDKRYQDSNTINPSIPPEGTDSRIPLQSGRSATQQPSSDEKLDSQRNMNYQRPSVQPATPGSERGGNSNPR